MIFENKGWGSLDIEIEDTKRSFFNPSINADYPFQAKGLGKESHNCNPFYIFEWQKIHYQYIIEENSRFHPPFELRVNDKTIKRSSVRNNNHLLSGQLSFDDEVGETKFEIRDASNFLLFELTTEVFPQKMDYKSDYKAMMAEISEIIENLAYDTLKSTFRRSKARVKGHSTESEWWSILDALFEQLIINIGVIKRQPKHEIKTNEKILTIDKVKRTSKKSLQWFQKNAQFSNNIMGFEVSKGKFFSHAMSSKKYITYNTYENRFIKWAIKNIIEQLRNYRKHIDTQSGSKNFTALTTKMKSYQGRLQSLLNESPFNEVSEFEKRTYFSTSLTRGAGYRDFLHIYLLLSRGLELADNDIFKIEQKNISTLYEYWCFLKLVQILKEQNSSNIEYQDLIKVKANKFKVELEKGLMSRVSFKKKDSNETTTIYFNREFRKEGKKVFTFNQRPDYSIEFKKDGFEKPFWYILDAKYRFNENKDLENNNYDVPQDAIGQLHRYRDAILHTEPSLSTYRGAVKNLGGIILYPYPLSEKDFKGNTFFKSIEHVNIGALPFLPSKSGLVTDLLNNLINKKLPEEHYEQFIEMDKTDYTESRTVWNEWISIGVIPKKDQEKRFSFLNEKQIFHVPFVKNQNSKIYLSQKVLICKAETKQAILYKVKSWEILTASELLDLGTDWNHREKKYIAFHIEKVQELITPKKISPIKFRYTTTEGFNRYLKSPEHNKDYFYLTTPDSARLYRELKNKEIDFKIHWSKSNDDSSLIYFKVKENSIFSSDKYPDFHYKLNNKVIKLSEVISIITND